MFRRSARPALFALAIGAASFGNAAMAQEADTTVAAPETSVAAPDTTAAVEATTETAPEGGVAAGGGFLSDDGSSVLPAALALGAVGAAGAIYVSRRRRSA